MRALTQIADWPVTTAACAVVTADGSVAARHGDTARCFPLASVTKPLSAYAVLVAAEEGALSLDDPAGPAGSTVAHLLAHCSGLAPDEPRRIAEPGTRRIYSNAGFEALAAYVEQRTEIPFPEYAADAVFAPLGMADTTIVGSPAAGAESSVEDLLRFAAELQAPRLLDPDIVRRATTVAFPGLTGVLPGFGRQDPNDWGLGFELRDRKSPHWTGGRSSPATYGHFGRSGTFLWVDPQARAACVCLTDREFGPWAARAWPELTDAVLAELAG